MKWTDKRNNFLKTFSEVQVGEGFEYEGILFIKVQENLSFNIMNNRMEEFGSMDHVYIRDVEIIFS